MNRKHVLVAVALAALCVISALPPAFGSVALLYFNATAGESNIALEWQTATEFDVVVFRVYRSETESPADWGSPITTTPAQGDAVTGHTYQYTDAAVTPAVKYYYLLREETSTGETDVASTSAGVGVPTDTTTPTATGTRAVTATWTPTPTVQTYTTATLTPPRPTATRRFTDGPPTAQPGTPTTPVATAVPPRRAPTQTPLPVARVATPTGLAPKVTVPVAAVFTAVPVLAAAAQPGPIITPTPDLVAIAEGTQMETPTPVPTKDLTPAIFSSEAEGKQRPTAESAEQVAGQGSGSRAAALVVGGGAIGLAALVVAALLFLRSRRS